MSCHYEDWKTFDVHSSHLHIKDVSDGSETILSRIKPGKWFAFCEYDEDFKKIERVILGHEDTSSIFMDGMNHREQRRYRDSVYTCHKSSEFDKGMMVIASPAHEGGSIDNPPLGQVLSQMIDESINVPRIASNDDMLFACLANPKNEHNLDILVIENKEEQYQVEGIEMVVVR